VTLTHLSPDVEIIRETRVGLSTVYTVRRLGNPHLIRRFATFVTTPTTPFVQRYGDAVSISAALHRHGALERDLMKLQEARARQ